MQVEAQPGTVGYVSTFVEMFAWVMTPKAYRALWELLYPYVNPYGWGYDLWYDNYAGSKVPGHKMGIISRFTAKHDQDFSASFNGRTDTAPVKVKWQAVLDQQKYYSDYMGIKLNKRFNIKNTSWNGAVQGYLYWDGAS